jgi:hypothetical protein
VLGFEKKTEVPLGAHRWLTVVSPEEPDGVELVLEPDEHPAAKPFKTPWSRTGSRSPRSPVADVEREYERLSALGVVFTQAPRVTGPVTTAVLDDTCGNLIQIAASPPDLRPTFVPRAGQSMYGRRAAAGGDRRRRSVRAEGGQGRAGARGVIVIAEARDGHQAVELTLRHLPDVVVMDVVMPGFDGVVATRGSAGSSPSSS